MTTTNDEQDWTIAHVARIPKCDFCDAPAEFDGRMAASTMWAFMCSRHFDEHGIGRLGLGFGQQLIEVGPDF